MDRYNTIILTLNDGRKITAMVPEFLKEGDEPVWVTNIRVIGGNSLPEGCFWEPLEKEEPR